MDNQELQKQLANSKMWQHHWNEESTKAKAKLRAVEEWAMEQDVEVREKIMSLISD